MGLILLVMALIFFASTLTQQGSLFSDEMTYQEFMTSVENGAIETALIRQNAQTPTGVVMTILKDGERGRIAVSDVMEVQRLFREKGIDYLVDDVPRDNYLMTIIHRSLCRGDHVPYDVHERPDRRRRREQQDDELWKKPGQNEPYQFRGFFQGCRS